MSAWKVRPQRVYFKEHLSTGSSMYREPPHVRLARQKRWVRVLCLIGQVVGLDGDTGDAGELGFVDHQFVLLLQQHVAEFAEADGVGEEV